jgi:oxalate decarboxylase
MQDQTPDANATSRGKFLGAAALTAATSVLTTATAASAAESGIVLKKSNTDKFPPLGSFTYNLTNSSSGWNGPAGWAKEVNVSNFPISESIAGVHMHLNKGSVRELHWHAIAAEWAYILNGVVLTTVVAPDGTVEENEFQEGDIWYFPKGHGHALQGLTDCDFLLGFDSGHFSEFGTFSITDWISKVPPHVAARNLGVPVEVIKSFPQGEAYIVPGTAPTYPAAMRNTSVKTSALTHKHHLRGVTPHEFDGGEERIVSQNEFPVQSTLTSVLMNLKPGSLRELHWHPNADEWQYINKGHGRVGIFGAHGRYEVKDVGPGDVVFIPQGFGHFIEQRGSDPTELLILFSNPHYQEISISEWLAGNPAEILTANFGINRDMAAKMPKRAFGILG